MSQKAKSVITQPVLTVTGDVVRQIRQHARTSPTAEICGVLIGQDRPGKVEIRACIAGANAEEGGAHVTFTQDTWEHIYQVKDKEYPSERIVGWYHSHPGFGVFLSDHDTFIHKNFFASPGQVAWVYDPHSDEEGCFGWMDGRIERLSQITISDRRGGERVPENAGPEPTFQSANVSIVSKPSAKAQSELQFTPRTSSSETDSETSNDSLLRLTVTVFTYLTVLLLGFLISWYFFPRVEILPVPVDPITGRPLPGYSLEKPEGSPATPSQDRDRNPEQPAGTGGKEAHVQSK